MICIISHTARPLTGKATKCCPSGFRCIPHTIHVIHIYRGYSRMLLRTGGAAYREDASLCFAFACTYFIIFRQCIQRSCQHKAARYDPYRNHLIPPVRNPTNKNIIAFSSLCVMYFLPKAAFFTDSLSTCGWLYATCNLRVRHPSR